MIRLGNTANGASYDKGGKPTDIFEIATLNSFFVSGDNNVMSVF